MNRLLQKFFLAFMLFGVTSIFAADYCNYFIDEANELKPEESQAFFKGKIDYSRVYVRVPFLEELKPGIYIHVHDAVTINAYIPKNAKTVQVYKEPSLPRSEIDRFTPCIDKHVKANLDYFLKTCLFENKISHDGVFDLFASFLRKKNESLKQYCNCEEKIYTSIIYIMDDGGVRLKEFNSPNCLDESFDVDPIVREWRTIDSLVKELVQPFDDKCDWRNLLPDPQKFSDEKYKNADVRYILTEKDCPAL